MDSNDKDLELRKLLIRHEGLRLKPYVDTTGNLTIGVGRNIHDIGISEIEAMYLLRNDINRVKLSIEKYFPWFVYLDQARKDVIISMCFNLGVAGFSKFTKTITAIINKDFETASKEMMNSLWAKQVGKRAHELSEMMRTGKYA